MPCYHLHNLRAAEDLPVYNLLIVLEITGARSAERCHVEIEVRRTVNELAIGQEELAGTRSQRQRWNHQALADLDAVGIIEIIGQDDVFDGAAQVVSDVAQALAGLDDVHVRSGRRRGWGRHDGRRCGFRKQHDCRRDQALRRRYRFSGWRRGRL